jgi:hypothetical protein
MHGGPSHRQFDADCSASIDTDELREVFKHFGLTLNFLQLRAVVKAATGGKA